MLPGEQAPCVLGRDEAAIGFVSDRSFSGSRVEWSVTLPPASSHDAGVMASFWVGMWVAGVPCSYMGESFASFELYPPASPSGNGSSGANWTSRAPVYDLAPASSCDPFCTNDTAFYTVQGSEFCEDNVAVNPAGVVPGTGQFAPSDSLAITWVGAAGGPQPLELFVNDSQHPADSLRWIYASAVMVTGIAITPFYDVSGPAASGWTSARNTAFGWRSCPSIGTTVAALECNSYDGPILNATLVPEVTNVSSWNGSTRTYSNPYATVESSSSSGACRGPAASCAEFHSLGGTGSYPYFSLHAAAGRSWFDLGGALAGEVSSYGGSASEFSSSGNPSRLNPAAATDLRATASGGSLNVTAVAADPSGVQAVRLTGFWCFSGAVRSVMSQIATLGSGAYDTSWDGNWSAALPLAGHTGTFDFWVEAESAAGTWGNPSYGSANVSTGSSTCSAGPPAAPGFLPTNVTVVGGGYRLNWTESSTGVERFTVWANASGNATAVPFPAGSASTVRLGLANATRYTLWIEATSVDGLSANSSKVAAPATASALELSVSVRPNATWGLNATITVNATAVGGVGPVFAFGFACNGGPEAPLLWVNGTARSAGARCAEPGYSGAARLEVFGSDSVADESTSTPRVVPIWATPLGVPQAISAGDRLVNVSWATPTSPLAPVRNYSVYLTNNVSQAPFLTGGGASNRTQRPGVTVWTLSPARHFLLLPFPDGIPVFGQVVATDPYGIGDLPTALCALPSVGTCALNVSPLLVATPQPLTVGPILGLPGGSLPFTDAFSAEVTAGTNDNVTSAIYSFPTGFVYANVSGSNGTFWANASFSFITVGVQSVTLHVTDRLFDVAIASSEVFVAPGAPPAFSIIVHPLPPWPATWLTFSAVVTAGVGPFAANWSFGDGGAATGLEVNHSYSVPGPYLVTVVVSDLGTQSSTVLSKSLAILALPTVVIRTTAEPNGTFTFEAVLAGGSGPPIVVWTFGDGTVGRGVQVNHSYVAPGSYRVTVSVADPSGRSATDAVVVLVPGLSGGSSTGSLGSSAGWIALSVALGVLAATALAGLFVARRQVRSGTTPPALAPAEEGDVDSPET